MIYSSLFEDILDCLLVSFFKEAKGILINEVPLTLPHLINQHFFNFQNLEGKLLDLLSPLVKQKDKLLQGKRVVAGRMSLSPTILALHITAAK